MGGLPDQTTAASHLAHSPLEAPLSQGFLDSVAEYTKGAIRGLFPMLEALSFQQHLVGYIPLLSQRSQLDINYGTGYENSSSLSQPELPKEIVVDLTKEETPDHRDIQRILKAEPGPQDASPEGRGVKRSAEDSPVQRASEDWKLPFKKRRRVHYSAEGGLLFVEPCINLSTYMYQEMLRKGHGGQFKL